MKISIVIPTYDRPKFLLRAINSVIAQTEKNWELLIVDDNGISSIAQVATERALLPMLKDSRIM
jgi:glycosyltransferase involved in cell wall biosynthesis